MTGAMKMAMIRRTDHVSNRVTDRNVGGRPVDDVGGKVYERTEGNYGPENRRDSRGRYAPRNGMENGYNEAGFAQGYVPRNDNGSMQMHDDGWVVKPIRQEMNYRTGSDGDRMIGFEGKYDSGSMEMTAKPARVSKPQIGHGKAAKPEHLDHQTAKEWVEAMGEQFSMEKTMDAMKQRKCTCEPLEYWAICNAMKSDFRRTAMKYGLDKMDFYADLAMDWLEDEDAKEGKAALYYEHIVAK